MDSREPIEDHELADERAKWLLNLLLDRIHFYVTTDASASDVAEVIESLDEWDAFDSECAALVQIPKGFYTSDAQEAVDAALRRPSPVAESTPTDATAVEAERDVVCDDWFFRHANRRDPNALINTHPTYFADECAAALTSGKLRARTKES